MDTSFSIRRFLPEDLAVYKAMRLEALYEEPGMFGNSHALESSFTEAQWLDRLTNPDGACFGLYAGDTLIGITAVVINEKVQQDEAYLTQSYIRKEWRGRGLSRLLYQIRLRWAHERGLRSVLIGHRAGNLVSKAANQHFGFRYSHAETRNWPDGSTEDMLYYRLELM